MPSTPSARTLRRGDGGRRRLPRPLGQGRDDAGHGQEHGREADHLRHGQSRSRDHAGRVRGGAPRRHRRHRPLGLSEPGQQRAGLPLHLPRRARRARPHHQRGDEDRRRPGARRAGARGRARRSRRRLCRTAAALRPRIHHPRAVRSAADLDASRPRSPRRRWIPAWRAGRSSTWRAIGSELSARLDPIAASLQRIFEQRARQPAARRVRRGRGGEGRSAPRSPFAMPATARRS